MGKSISNKSEGIFYYAYPLNSKFVPKISFYEVLYGYYIMETASLFKPTTDDFGECNDEGLRCLVDKEKGLQLELSRKQSCNFVLSRTFLDYNSLCSYV